MMPLKGIEQPFNYIIKEVFSMFRKPSVRRIIELLDTGLSEREVARALHASRNTVAVIKGRLPSCEQTTEQLLTLSNGELYEMFFPDRFMEQTDYEPVDCGYVHAELKKVGVTLKLLWEEYSVNCKAKGRTPCSYATFTRVYGKYTNRCDYSSHVSHKPGVTVEVDWSGPTMTYYDPETDVPRKAYLFVATLPYSQFSYVEATESMNENAWLGCHVNMFDFFGGVPLKIVCDNLKTGVVSHPKDGDILLNESYLSLAEHYSIAIMPAGVKKPKHKASVEGTVGKIATAVIAKLRNEKFYSVEGINYEIRRVLKEFNETMFQKREGSRKIVFDAEERPYLRPLPLIPYEVSEWVYGCKVNPSCHIWFKKNQYSVPGKFIGEKVDIRYTRTDLFVYYNRDLIAKHKLLPTQTRNGKRTDPAHLPYPQFEHLSPEKALEEAGEIGPSVKMMVIQFLDNSKIKEQALLPINSLFRLSGKYCAEELEAACKTALSTHRYPTVEDVRNQLKRQKKQTDNRTPHANGIVRGADYYRKAGKTNEF